MDRYDIAIIGTGPAGLSAAITATIRNKKVLLLGSRALSEKLGKAHEIRNYLGFPAVSGEALAEAFTAHLDSMGISITEKRISAVYAMGDWFALQSGDEMLEASSVILATGVVQGKPLPGETELLGRGVSYCATCDGNFYRNKDCLVIGGGDTAVADALYLSKICRKVYLAVRRGELRAAGITAQAALNTENLTILWHTELKEVMGEKKVTSVRLIQNQTKEESVMPIDGVFVAVGISPTNELLAGIVKTDEAGFVYTDEDMQTSVPGIFAAGDIRVKPLRQIITAAADGAVAVNGVMKYLR